jgi:predicted PurR-regulated permease PerM
MFIIIPSTIVAIFLVKQIVEFYPHLINFFSEGNILEKLEKNIPFLAKIDKEIFKFIDTYELTKQLEVFAKKYITSVMQFIFQQGKEILFNIILVILGIMLMTLTIFFLFKDGEKLYRKVYSLIPLSDKDKNFIIFRTYQAIQGVVLGAIFTAAAQGVLGFIAYFTAGIDFALMWAFLTFIASFIPVGGASLVWVPLSIYVLATKGWIAFILFVLWGVFVISSIDNFIKPWIIGDKTNLHPIILFFAILGGLNLFGFLGIFLAPIIIVILDNLLLLYKERYHITE